MAAGRTFSMLALLLGASSAMEKNEFETGNTECPRLRRPWRALSDADKQLYIDGLLKLRADTAWNPTKSHEDAPLWNDEFSMIALTHHSDMSSADHFVSNWFMWHGYLAWEVESRIRNLGGDWACFGLPYWDYTSEVDPLLRDPSDDPLIFEDSKFVGGYGDPNDEFTVNGYSWDVSVEEWYMPVDEPDSSHNAFQCNAKDDVFPVCSFKRAVQLNDMQSIPSARMTGDVIKERTEYAAFLRFFLDEDGGPPFGMSNFQEAFDPLWWLFHSFVQYQQFMWVDCHDYDLIDADELDDYPEAYSVFCLDGWVKAGSPCDAQELDDVMTFALDILKDVEWSFIHDEELTVRKSYHAPRWNILYDLRGDDFFAKSGLEEACANKLNADWFVLDDVNPNVAVEAAADKLLGVENREVGAYGPWALGVVAVLMLAMAAWSLWPRSAINKSLLASTAFATAVNEYGAV